MKALCLVAHPDDCLIFGYSYIYNHPELDWTICYLTYDENSDRGKEFSEFWSKRNIKTQFLRFLDDYTDQLTQKLNFWDRGDAEAACWKVAKEFDLVLTHDANGDYGHIHHRLVHDSVKQHHNVVTFAAVDTGDVKYSVPPEQYSLAELPLHKDVIQAFYTATHTNEYKALK